MSDILSAYKDDNKISLPTAASVVREALAEVGSTPWTDRLRGLRDAIAEPPFRAAVGFDLGISRDGLPFASAGTEARLFGKPVVRARAGRGRWGMRL